MKNLSKEEEESKYHVTEKSILVVYIEKKPCVWKVNTFTEEVTYIIFTRTLSRNWKWIFPPYYSPAGMLWLKLAESMPHCNAFNGVHGYN